MNTEYGMVVSFPDQSETFVLGFEAGLISQRMKSGEQDFEVTMHTKNAEVIRRMVKAEDLQVQITETEVDGWSNARVTLRPRLKLVKN